jgi:aminobenzoyl-glutamate utilization protein B
MRRSTFRPLLAVLILGASAPSLLSAQADARLESLKAEALGMVEDDAKMVQEIVDMLFSFGELGMQEFETQRYLTGILEEHGFAIELGVAGMPSAWTARWSNGTGEPVIALGSDVDGIPQSNQKPGVAYRDPILSMAPGHGEGHNSGQAVNIVAALNVKELMERERIDGTLLIWPGIAEEQLGSKAFFVREGVFDGVDVNLFTHVSSNFSMTWGHTSGNALVSTQFRFRGETAHSAGSPWRMIRWRTGNSSVSQQARKRARAAPSRGTVGSQSQGGRGGFGALIGLGGSVAWLHCRPYPAAF